MSAIQSANRSPLLIREQGHGAAKREHPSKGSASLPGMPPLRCFTFGSWLMSFGFTAGTIRARGIIRPNNPPKGAWALCIIDKEFLAVAVHHKRMMLRALDFCVLVTLQWIKIHRQLSWNLPTSLIRLKHALITDFGEQLGYAARLLNQRAQSKLSRVIVCHLK